MFALFVEQRARFHVDIARRRGAVDIACDAAKPIEQRREVPTGANNKSTAYVVCRACVAWSRRWSLIALEITCEYLATYGDIEMGKCQISH